MYRTNVGFTLITINRCPFCKKPGLSLLYVNGSGALTIVLVSIKMTKNEKKKSKNSKYSDFKPEISKMVKIGKMILKNYNILNCELDRILISPKTTSKSPGSCYFSNSM